MELRHPSSPRAADQGFLRTGTQWYIRPRLCAGWRGRVARRGAEVPAFSLIVNGSSRRFDGFHDTPLLWVLRDSLGLTATKFGCGEGLCGVCTVHLDGEPVRACVTTIAEADGRRVTTLEALAAAGHTLLAAWIAESTSQCGYCQPGQIMTAAALLARTPRPTDDEIVGAMAGNLCRCGTYLRIRRAVRRVAEKEAAR